MDKLREDYYNRWFPDPQEARVWARCYYTGLEIYEGEDYIQLPNGRCLKDDIEVLIAYINGIRVTAGEE